MKLSGALFILTSLCSLIKQGHGVAVGRASTAPHNLTLLSARSGGRARDITIVTDVLKTDGMRSNIWDDNVYPTSTWILFWPTDLDGPLRVEIVAPTINGQPKGLAIAVTEHATEPASSGQSEGPPALQNTERKVFVQRRATTLRNLEIFDPSLPSSTGGRQSLVEYHFLMNALAFDRLASLPPHRSSLISVYSSTTFEFAMRLLNDLLPTSSLPPSKNLDSLMQDDWEAVEWESRTRRQNRGGRDDLLPRSMPYLFYEGPSDRRSKDDGPQPGRQLFDIDKSDRASYRVRSVGQEWESFLPSIGQSAQPPQVLELSRDPRLTSDVLPLGARGSLEQFLCATLSPGGDPSACARLGDSRPPAAAGPAAQKPSTSPSPSSPMQLRWDCWWTKLVGGPDCALPGESQKSRRAVYARSDVGVSRSPQTDF